MAVEQIVFDEICKFAPARILSLGYPDLLLSGPPVTKVQENSDRISKYHNWSGPTIDTESAFKAVGLDAVYVDISSSRGIERIVDLNSELPEDLAGQFDIVLDPGTLEHCFNIGQAFRNIFKALKPKGTVIHVNPVSMINHGFWNLSPTAYYDWYTDNGFDSVTVRVIWGAINQRNVQTVPPISRYKLPPEASCFVTATRSNLKADQPLWPVQSKYKRNPSLMA
jgi:hypothetical protein